LFLQLLAVWFFFVETRGYTLEEIWTIFDTPGLTWKQRRNMKAPGTLQGPIIAAEATVQKDTPVVAVSEKSERSTIDN
jgi:hypothetical protein